MTPHEADMLYWSCVAAVLFMCWLVMKPGDD